MPSKIVARPVTPAPSGTLCGFWHSYGPNSRAGYGCMSGKPEGPGTAVHVLTTDHPVAPAGTPLCAYHSPYDVVRRWELTLSPDTGKGRDVHTFTWGRTRTEAYARVVDMMDDGDTWDGWSFTLANEPTPGVYA